MPANSLLFKPSVTQPIIQTPYDPKSERLVHFSSHVLNNKLLVHYSSHDLNNQPFNEQTILDHLNTELFIQIPTVIYLKSYLGFSSGKFFISRCYFVHRKWIFCDVISGLSPFKGSTQRKVCGAERGLDRNHESGHRNSTNVWLEFFIFFKGGQPTLR